ncbi:MAG: glycosyltransferase family 9 protein [Alphaproteobacteria bacterium]|nr:glycosyltransferase family 9 protein [Alphaproteobacteria bacterium]
MLKNNIIERLDRRFFRYVRYIAYNFRRELVDGPPERRRFFFGRMTDAAARLLHIDIITRALFMATLRLSPAMRAQWPQRRWLWAIRGLESRAAFDAWLSSPAQPTERAPRIVIFGGGSIGDLFQITPILRAMRAKFPDGDIAFLHRSPAVKAILGNNPHINSIGFANFSAAARLRDAVAREGVADLLLEIESGTYVAQYTRAPEALRAPSIAAVMPDAVFAQAAQALRDRRTRPDFRRADGTFAWPPQWSHHHFLETLGATTGLPIDRNSDLDFDIAPQDGQFAASVVAGHKVITVQNGVDDAVAKWAHVTGRQATKLMPMPIWREAVQQLTSRGYYIVQLGTRDDAPIDGVSLDLRGKTTLRQAAAVIRHAVCHVGTEGGLVHLARAMKTRSVVLFGPTATEFFGYPPNINLSAGNCHGCWQSARDWFIYCPRGFEQAPCMNAHRPEDVVAAVERICAHPTPGL